MFLWQGRVLGDFVWSVLRAELLNSHPGPLVPGFNLAQISGEELIQIDQSDNNVLCRLSW